MTASPLNTVTISMPARAVLTLLQLAGRAPLLDAERLWLEGIDRDVAATLRAGMPPAAGTATRVTTKDGRQFIVPPGEPVPDGPDIERVETYSG